ncbi:MAG: hypothetical protein AW12_01567 [Candidatus Accumulibacter sp. BA-94]|nr:MAG: hypothetical protein AW12_01567 [Candidatus Accumulibacter sp. BA-94]
MIASTVGGSAAERLAAERLASPKLSGGALTATANSSGEAIIFASRR